MRIIPLIGGMLQQLMPQ